MILNILPIHLSHIEHGWQLTTAIQVFIFTLVVESTWIAFDVILDSLPIRIGVTNSSSFKFVFEGGSPIFPL
jgi:hypothetical protein